MNELNGQAVINDRRVSFTREELLDIMENGKPLVQYGIPGMKWYQRRSQKELARERAKRLDTATKEEKFLKKVGKKPSDVAKSLSDEELSSRIKRLEMEKKYVELMSQSDNNNRTTFGRGIGAVNKVLADSGKEVLKQAITRNTMDQLEKRGVVPKKKKK